MKHVGENIKRIRTAKKMTISDLANEHVSRGMISLIENGKTQPSIERLHHIAVQLDVDISELVEEISREELRVKINEAYELLKTHDVDDVLMTISILHPLLNKTSHSYEAARIYEMYAKSLYHLYIYANEAFSKIDENDWELYATKAIALYTDLQMDWRVIRIWGFLANIKFLQANYGETIEIIDKGIEKLTVKDGLETKVTYIELMHAKAATLMAMGEIEEAHRLLDSAIEFSRNEIILTYYYQLLNMKALLYYDERNYIQARKYVADASAFVQMIQRDDMRIEYELTKIIFEEFFEKNFEQTIRLSDEFEFNLLTKNSFNQSIKEEVLIFSRNLKARAFTRLGRYKEALLLFEVNQIKQNDLMEMSPIDISIREISKSYEAICHFHEGDVEKAEQLARHAVEKLHKLPYSSYYQFAREVLGEVT